MRIFYDDFYENYKQKYEIIKKQREIAKRDEIASTEKYKLEPNSMQVGFITVSYTHLTLPTKLEV